MIHCGKCGQENPESDLFCRRCGTSFVEVHSPQPEKRDFEKSPPRPYSWNTGEFTDRHPGARPTGQMQVGVPINDPFRTSELPTVHRAANLKPVYRCPHCGTTALPIVAKKVSAAGWTVFTVLLIFTLFLFWIGLLMQEEVRICSVCNKQVS